MNSKNRKTLAAIFATPQRKAINWPDIETLLLAIGAELIEGRGSRLRFEVSGQMLTLHNRTLVKKLSLIKSKRFGTF